MKRAHGWYWSRRAIADGRPSVSTHSCSRSTLTGPAERPRYWPRNNSWCRLPGASRLQRWVSASCSFLPFRCAPDELCAAQKLRWASMRLFWRLVSALSGAVGARTGFDYWSLRRAFDFISLSLSSFLHNIHFIVQLSSIGSVTQGIPKCSLVYLLFYKVMFFNN